ncbi:MAG: methylmalonyl Co-A mutase-associated GTPase MeaB [Flavobacteriaceae bacterium]|nr:methylmalonyl Co-A mutase-associated GTPase MeaB [Flavobacteriaceae bacterium]
MGRQKTHINPDKILEIRTQREVLLNTATLSQKILKGDTTSLSKAITLLESTHKTHQKQAAALLEKIIPKTGKSIRIGITGVPGVGKSTFIEQFGLHFIRQGKKVAVLAIDPSSPVSGGSILGDKTRMEKLSGHPNAYIRPTAAGSTLGGVAKRTRETIYLCEAAGFDVIFIETVGVGQSETLVHSMTDFFLLMHLTGAGDSLQGIKRGVIEMADAIVINKADGDNLERARRAKNELQNALHIWPPKSGNWLPPVMMCSAIENSGIVEIAQLIDSYLEEHMKNGHFENKRKAQQRFWFHQALESQLKTDFYENEAVKVELKNITKTLEHKNSNPFILADQLLKKYYERLSQNT